MLTKELKSEAARLGGDFEAIFTNVGIKHDAEAFALAVMRRFNACKSCKAAQKNEASNENPNELGGDNGKE